MPVYLLTNDLIFPSPHLASEEGLLAVGGDLSQERLLLAYRMGIFPWYSDNEPILWWSPDPRLVLYPREIHISKTLKKVIKKGVFQMTVDKAFERVIQACAHVHGNDDGGTWIVYEMVKAYRRLHLSGFAHSVEAWYDGELVGGLYGVSLGRSFFGESMFSRMSNASSVALVTLASYLKEKSFDMIDCQVTTTHLKNFGAIEIPRERFLAQLKESLSVPTIEMGARHTGGVENGERLYLLQDRGR
jgi:leucyl/phenylalanyl-tRNA--protein transferase